MTQGENTGSDSKSYCWEGGVRGLGGVGVRGQRSRRKQSSEVRSRDVKEVKMTLLFVCLRFPMFYFLILFIVVAVLKSFLFCLLMVRF